MSFVGSEVVARARCNLPDAKVVLLGKPKGICPNCTDDLVVKHEIIVHEPGEVVLKDTAPQSDYMIYRISAEHGSTRWSTTARIVVKK